MSKFRLMWRAWLYSAFAYISSGVVNSILAVAIAPEFFHDLNKVGKLAASSAIFNLFLYIKKTPFPQFEETTVTTTTESAATTTETTTVKE